MVNPSTQLRGFLNRIYIFGFSAFSVKILPISSLRFQDIEIGLENKTVLVGLLSLITALLTLAAICSLLRDFIQTRISDHLEFKMEDEMVQRSGHSDVVSERIGRLSSLYIPINALAFFIESVLPIIFGVFIFGYCAKDFALFVLSLIC